MSLSKEEEKGLAALAGVTLSSISEELTQAWWTAYQGLQSSNAWARTGNMEDYEIALEIVRMAVSIRYGKTT